MLMALTDPYTVRRRSRSTPGALRATRFGPRAAHGTLRRGVRRGVNTQRFGHLTASWERCMSTSCNADDRRRHHETIALPEIALPEIALPERTSRAGRAGPRAL